MTGFNHVLTGIAIAVIVKHPVAAPLLALLSHFVLDALPHFGGPEWFERWGKPLRRMVIADATLCLLSVVGGIMLFPNIWAIILVCATAATLPDWLWIFYYKYKIRHRFFEWHLQIQRYERPWGGYVEATYALALGICLWNLHF
jgi:hypothetical protein